MVIRRASIEEVPRLAETFKVFEECTDQIKIDPKHATKTYRRLIDSDTGGILLLEEAGKLMGGLGYIITIDLHYPRKIAVETFWFVLPECRSRGAGIRLLNAFEELSLKEGCSQIAMVHLSDSYPERLRELYLHRGYDLQESHYVKEL